MLKLPKKTRTVPSAKSPSLSSSDDEDMPSPQPSTSASALSKMATDRDRQYMETQQSDFELPVNMSINDDTVSDSSFSSGPANLDETTSRLHEMIDTCQELDDNQGCNADADQVLRKQVQQSAKMFETQFMSQDEFFSQSQLGEEGDILDDGDELEEDASQIQLRRQKTPAKNKNLIQTPGSTRSSRKNTTLASSAVKQSHMYLAYKHTNMCVKLMRKRTQMMDLEETAISVDEYLTALKASIEIPTEGNPDEDEVNRLHKALQSMWKPAVSLPTLVGSFDYKEFLEKENVEIVKPVKRPPTRKANQFDPSTLVATQREINITKEASKAKSKANDDAVKDFRRDLQAFAQSHNDQETLSMLQFTVNKNSVRDSLNNIFGVAFGVRDGTIALHEEGGRMKISPSNPPENDESTNQASRRQCIFSISAATMRKLMADAKGENAIRPGNRAIEDQLKIKD